MIGLVYQATYFWHFPILFPRNVGNNSTHIPHFPHNSFYAQQIYIIER